MNAPMPPSVRLEQQVLTTCQIFYSTTGRTDAHTSKGMRARATIWDLTGRKPSLQDLEDVLEAIEERARIESNTLGLWDGTAELRPGHPDYAAAKTEHLDIQDGLITEAIRRLIPKAAGQ